ncbi:MAG: hypothetical protein AABY09_01280 [Nanoarchaeota archaeon]|mgnify:CR=1 FL=1
MDKSKVITQIGSLPFDNVEDAVNYSLRHDIPFLPELPKIKGDSMIEYVHHPGNLACSELFKSRTYDVVKIQAIGPITLMQQGYNEDDAMSIPYNHIEGMLRGLNAKEVILFLDEPAVGHTGIDFNPLWDALFSSFNVIPGVHICGNMDWDKMFKSKLEIISFDATSYDLTNYPNYRSGKRIAWGVKSLEDVKDFQAGDLITLPCGMSPSAYSASDAYPVLQRLNSIKSYFLK